MPSSYLIDRTQRVVVVITSGVVTARLYLKHIEIMRRDPQFEPRFSLLFDARQVVDVQVTHSEMLALTTRTVFDADARRAIVANEGLVFGMARMYELSFADGATRRVFSRMAEAEAWLGVNYARSLELPQVVVADDES